MGRATGNARGDMRARMLPAHVTPDLPVPAPRSSVSGQLTQRGRPEFTAKGLVGINRMWRFPAPASRLSPAHAPEPGVGQGWGRV